MVDAPPWEADLNMRYSEDGALLWVTVHLLWDADFDAILRRFYSKGDELLWGTMKWHQNTDFGAFLGILGIARFLGDDGIFGTETLLFGILRMACC